MPQTNDLILAREAPAGNIAIVKDGQQVCLGQRTVHLRPDPQIVDPDFLCYLLLSPMHQALLLSAETGATAKHVNMKDIRKLPLMFLPEKTVQKRIASILTAYDDLIENNRRRIELLEQAARLLYKEWFVHLRFPGHEHVKMVDGVPEGWSRVTLVNLCEAIRVSVDPSSVPSETPYIGLEHIPRRSITLSAWGHSHEVASNKFAFTAGDILFGKIRPYFHKVGFALVDGITSSDAIVVRPVEPKFQLYCLTLLSSDEFVSLASKTVREGSKMPRADWGYLQKCGFVRPADKTLEEFNLIIEPMVEQMRTLALQSRGLSHARDLLLPRLMNGEIAI